MDSRKIILATTAIMAIGLLGSEPVKAKVTDKQVAEVARRNFKVPAEDTRVAIVMYVKDEVKDGVVYESQRPVKVFEYKYQAEKYVKEHEDIHEYKRGLYAGELRIVESNIKR
ncbi:MAG: hypothetical protein MJZ20_05090 [Bacteroidaceae bacterium]|nr:hypothetical protein [Bacteroidaceae bacterium]